MMKCEGFGRKRQWKYRGTFPGILVKNTEENSKKYQHCPITYQR
jgi:hypothetical protein